MASLSNNNGRWALLLCAATVAIGCSIQGWLTDSRVSSALWPADVHLAVIGLFGGTATSGVSGGLQYTVGAASSIVRLGIILGLLILACGFVKKRIPAVAIRRTTMLFSGSSCWWLIWLLGDIGVLPASQFAMGIVPMWVTATTGAFCWIWADEFLRPALSVPVPATAPPTSALPVPQQSLTPLAVLLTAMVGWIGVSFWMNFCLYEQLLIPHGDSAMYEEHLWNVWHGKGFRSYLDQGLFLGEHIQVIHLLLLPLHMLWPSHLLLELAESVALASCAIPIFRIAKRKTSDSWVGAFFGMAWLLYFPMHFLDIAIDQKTFRPIALGVPFLFWLVEFTEVRRYGAALVCLILALSAKEDIALITFPLLLVLAIRARSRQDAIWPGLMAIGSVIYLLVVVLLLIPWFRSGEVVHYSRYFGDLGNSPGELVKTSLREPSRVIAQAFSVQTVLYVFVFLLPLAFLSLRSFLCVSAGVLTFGMLSLLQFGDESGLPPVPYHHFHAPLLVVVFWSAICGLPTKTNSNLDSGSSRSGSLLFRNLQTGRAMRARSAAGLALCLCAATGITSSIMPFGVAFWSQQSSFGYHKLYSPTDPQQQERARMVAEVLKQVPMSARVAATDFIHTRLTHRERSYDYSDYLRKVNGYKPGVPADTDYIVIDTRHKYSTYRQAADVPELNNSDEWELLPDTTNGAFVVLRRKSGGKSGP